MKSIYLLLCLVGIANAWWDYGHLLTARIAQSILEKDDPKTLKAVLSILETLKITDPKWTQNEENHPFTECATFADFIKDKKNGQYQKSWHFVDQPFLSDGGKIEDFNFDANENNHNITEVIMALVDWFKLSESYKDSYEYQEIMDHTYKEHS